MKRFNLVVLYGKSGLCELHKIQADDFTDAKRRATKLVQREYLSVDTKRDKWRQVRQVRYEQHNRHFGTVRAEITEYRGDTKEVAHERPHY